MEVACVYTGADGNSCIGSVRVPVMQKVEQEDGSSTWTNVQKGNIWGVTGSEGSVLAESFGPWHTSGHPMMSIVLCGSWEVETGSGERRVLEKGSLTVFLDDSGQGHRSRTFADDPATVIGIGIDDECARNFKEQLGIG